MKSSYDSFQGHFLLQGFFFLPSFHGIHQIGEIKFSSPAHQCGKIEEGDEVVQVNYQTVVSRACTSLDGSTHSGM
jgi:hypothetical protein